MRADCIALRTCNNFTRQVIGGSFRAFNTTMMMTRRLSARAALFALSASLPALALAQAAPPDPAGHGAAPARENEAATPGAGAPAEAMEDEAEIVVTGQKPRGSVVGNIPAEVTYGAREIRSLGVSSVTELLEALAPQIGSGQGRGGGGRPVVLINGLRTTGFAEVRDIPTEAIVRTEIFPEELALRYGFRSDQKVVNIVLRPRFRAVVTELTPSFATDGGRQGGRADATLLRIGENGRINVNARFQHQSPLYESERDIALDPALGGALDERPYRTLLAQTNTASLNASLNRKLNDRTALTATLRGETAESDAAIGAFLPGAEGDPVALLRGGITRSAEAGLMLSGNAAPWNWSLTGNYAVDHSRSTTDRSTGITDRARSTGQTASLEGVIGGSVFALPAGDANMTLTTRGELQDIDSESLRQGAERGATLERSVVGGQLSLDLPIASARRDVLGALGTLGLNLNAGVDRLSDFGTLTRYGAGLNWSPAGFIDLIGSYTREEGAPTMQQLGNPVDAVPDVRVFDFVRQENVQITQISGGNPALLADDRRVWKLGMTLRPFSSRDISFNVTYTNSRIDNFIASFPAATGAIEAAFPDRFVRDADGRLLSIDARPVNFARARDEQLRWGVNISRTFGKGRTPSTEEMQRFRDMMRGMGGPGAGQGGERPRARQGGAGGEGGGPGGGSGGGGFGGGGRGGPPVIGQTRVQFSLYHVWYLRDDLLPANGAPLIDLLDGGASDANGGQARHGLDARLSVNRNNIGMRVEANWRGATRVESGSGASAGSLRFSSRTTVNLRLFAQPGMDPNLVSKMPWLRGTRISLGVDNLFNSRPQVRDGSGLAPVNYQPDFLEPAGRTLRLSIRKLFF